MYLVMLYLIIFFLVMFSVLSVVCAILVVTVKNLVSINLFNYIYVFFFLAILTYVQINIMYNIYLQYILNYEDLFNIISFRLKLIPLVLFQLGLLPVFYSLYYKSKIDLYDLLYRLIRSLWFSIILVAIIQFVFIKYDVYGITSYILVNHIYKGLYVLNPWKPDMIILHAQAALGYKIPSGWLALFELQKKLFPELNPYKNFKIYAIEKALKIKSKL